MLIVLCFVWYEVYVWLEFLLGVWFDCYCLHWLMVCFDLFWGGCYVVISVFVVLCCYLLGFLWFLGVILYLLFRLANWLVLVLVIDVVVYLLCSFCGILFCGLLGMVCGSWLRLSFGLRDHWVLWVAGCVWWWVGCLVFRLFSLLV